MKHKTLHTIINTDNIETFFDSIKRVNLFSTLGTTKSKRTYKEPLNISRNNTNKYISEVPTRKMTS